VYDAEMGFPGLIIDGTACADGGGEPLSLSESNEDMGVGVSPEARRERGLQVDQNLNASDTRARMSSNGSL